MQVPQKEAAATAPSFLFSGKTNPRSPLGSPRNTKAVETLVFHTARSTHFHRMPHFSTCRVSVAHATRPADEIEGGQEMRDIIRARRPGIGEVIGS